MKRTTWVSTPLGSGFQLSIYEEGAEVQIRCFVLKEPTQRAGEIPYWTWRMRPPFGERADGGTCPSLQDAFCLAQDSAIGWIRTAPSYQVLSLLADEPVSVVSKLGITYSTMAQLLDPGDPLELSEKQRNRVIELLGGKRTRDGEEWFFADPPGEMAIESQEE